MNSPPIQSRIRGGFTLLEMLLALLIATVIFGAIGMAIDLQWRVVDSGRRDVAEAQLARALLQRMANDLRSTVRYEEIDIESMLPDVSAATSSALSGGGSNGTSGSGAATGGASSSSDGTTSNGVTNFGATPAGSATGGSSSGASSGGGRSSAGGSASGNSGSGSGSGTSAAGGSGSSGASPGNSSSTANSDLSEDAVVTSRPGLYGNQFQLQADVSRLPRVDQYNPLLATDSSTASEVPSDVKTVTYYVMDPAQASAHSAVGGGLVRREVDRAVTVFANENGDTSRLEAHDRALASEVVAVEFGYYDGAAWQTEWDSEVNEGLPVAVSISLVIGDPNAAAFDATAALASTNGGYRTYQIVVHLVSAEPASASDAATSKDGLSDSASSSGAASP